MQKNYFPSIEVNKNGETKFKKLSQRNIYVEKNMVKSRVNRLLYTGLDFVVCTSVMQKTLEFKVCGA